jgi:DNA-binding PadR family transcriptional regulator
MVPAYPDGMASSRIRMTTPVRLVLDALAHAGPDDPLWGYKLCEQTGLGSGTVYPIMERLESGGYVSARVETPRPADRPPRRFYELTGTGRELAASARKARTLRAAWLHHVADGPGAP